MAAAIQPAPERLTIEEYLCTAYHPDCDFVDDHLEERTLGSTKHARLQMWLGFWFLSHQKEWNVTPMGDVRTRVSQSRVRLPDVAVAYTDAALSEDIRVTPPLIAIEILSPDDRLSRVVLRLNDYFAMGIQNIWVLDPVERLAYTYTAEGLKLVQNARLTIALSPIYLDLSGLFSSLD